LISRSLNAARDLRPAILASRVKESRDWRDFHRVDEEDELARCPLGEMVVVEVQVGRVHVEVPVGQPNQQAKCVVSHLVV
jgi:hypothetical protein